MEVAAATASSFTTLRARTPAIISSSTRNLRSKVRCSSSSSLSNGLLSPYTGGSISTDFCGAKLRSKSLTPLYLSSSKPKRGVVTMVIPFSKGSAHEQPPPDLASYLFKNRIVYLGMSLVPSVTELILAEFLYLQYEDEEKPIYLYINSTGTTKNGEKLGYDTEAFAIYDVMGYVKPPIFTLCVGNAWGEAALLLTAGAKGNRSALPSSTIMIKQPIARFQGQATDVEIARKEIKHIKTEMVKLYSKHIGKSPEQIEADMKRPKYFSPSEAVELFTTKGAARTEELCPTLKRHNSSKCQNCLPKSPMINRFVGLTADQRGVLYQGKVLKTCENIRVIRTETNLVCVGL